MTTATNGRRRAKSALVVHPARHLPMDAERRARAIASFAALLTAHLRRDWLAPHALDSTGLVEVSSMRETSPGRRRADAR